MLLYEARCSQQIEGFFLEEYIDTPDITFRATLVSKKDQRGYHEREV